MANIYDEMTKCVKMRSAIMKADNNDKKLVSVLKSVKSNKMLANVTSTHKNAKW